MKKLTNDEKKEITKSFIKDLAKLSNKYQITISGCGCCGSPRLGFSSKFPIKYEYDEDGFDTLTSISIKND